jgi:hypothetical protein
MVSVSRLDLILCTEGYSFFLYVHFSKSDLFLWVKTFDAPQGMKFGLNITILPGHDPLVIIIMSPF